MSVLTKTFVHSASVETYAGSGMHGEVFAAPVVVPCFADDERKLVMNSNGVQEVSSSVLYADVSYFATFLLNSRVTLNGRVSRVLQSKRRSGGSFVVGLDHVEVDLT